MKKMKKYLLVELMSICMMFGIVANISASTSNFSNFVVSGGKYLPTGYVTNADATGYVSLSSLSGSTGIVVKATKATEVNYGEGTVINTTNRRYPIPYKAAYAAGTQMLAMAHTQTGLGSVTVSGYIEY